MIFAASGTGLTAICFLRHDDDWRSAPRWTLLRERNSTPSERTLLAGGLFLKLCKPRPSGVEVWVADIATNVLQ